MTSILEVKKRVGDVLLEREDITGVGVTPDRSTIIIYSRDPDLKFEFFKIGGYPIKIVPIGMISLSDDSTEHQKRIRPVIGGTSAGYWLRNTGTLGGIVYDNKTGDPYFISNNHVFGNRSTEKQPNARIGDTIIQPGVVDGGTISDEIALLADYIPWKEDDQLNIADAALASPSVPYIDIVMKNGIPAIPNGVAPLTRDERVWKVGRTSGYSEGSVSDLDFTVDVVSGTNPDGSYRYVRFVDQILLDINAAPGDSGALIFDSDNHVVGLLFAGGQMHDGSYFVVANKIRNVLSLVNCNIPAASGYGITSTSVSAPVIAGVGLIAAAAILYTITKRRG